MKFIIEELIEPYLKLSNRKLGGIARAIHYNITEGPIPPYHESLMSVLGLEEEEAIELMRSDVFELTAVGFFVKALHDAILKNSITVKKRREIVKKVDRKRYLIKGRKHV
jgi:hypothetical protein